MAAGDERVGGRRQQDQIGLGDRNRQRRVAMAQAAESGQPDQKRRLESGGVFAPDGVAPRGQAHAFQEGEGRGGADVLLFDLAETAGPGQADGAVGVPRVLHVEREQKAPQAVAERAA